jgi:hypothetical protein
MNEPVITLVNPGRAIEFSGKRSWGEKRRINIDRIWEVTIDGEVIGYVHYRLLTREQRTPGKRYVNSRWQSPGWTRSATKYGRSIEAYSKKDAIERLVNDYHRNQEG